MNESDKAQARTNETDTEVELSALDLATLSLASPSSSSEASVAAPATHRRSKLWRVALPVGLLLAAVAAGGALYTRIPTGEPPRLATSTLPQPEVLPEAIAEEPAPQPQAEPVRFANPFDKNEVFEFPPGTTKQEAKDAVATLLLERAAERRASDPKLKRKRH